MSTPEPLQAGPRKLKKNDNVKNRMSLAFRKTFLKPPSQAKPVSVVEPTRRSPGSSPSSLPSYAVASLHSSRGQLGPPPDIIRQSSIGTATREYGRSNKPQTAAAEGLVPRRSHIGAGAVGTSPPLPPIPPASVAQGRAPQITSAIPIDGLGIALDLSPVQAIRNSPPTEFRVLANVSHARHSRLSPIDDLQVKSSKLDNDPRPVEQLRLDTDRDRLMRARASISASSESDPALKLRGANRRDPTRCHTMAVVESDLGSLARPPKSALRNRESVQQASNKLSATTTLVTPAVAAWTSRSDTSARSSSAAALPGAGIYCLRPTVHQATQTPDWFLPPPVSPSSRRFSATTPPQAYASFTGMFGGPPARESFDRVEPSPSVYSIASFDTRARHNAPLQHKRDESRSSLYVEEIKETEEDLQDAIDRHLGELERSHGLALGPAIAVNYDLPFLDPSPYDTPQMRPFEIPPTPVALTLPRASSENRELSPALIANVEDTPVPDRTPTLPPSNARASCSTSPLDSPTSSTSGESCATTSTPPTSSASFIDEVSIQLAEQEPIQFRKASLVSSSSRKPSLVSTSSIHSVHSLARSAHSRSSSTSTKSVSFNLNQFPSTPSTEHPPKLDPLALASIASNCSSSDDAPVPLTIRRKSESDNLAAFARPRPTNSTTMSRAERAARGRSYFLVQALMGEELPHEGMIRDWAKDSDDSGSEQDDDDAGSIADSEI
ncbi:uncharacterized protein JCM15063_004993 [Sporobolomyces koalae]|uniref:uncharacterized protein n=1 Tax=Sporobolomyces koalae TaxID=500713 RepID=UPI00317797A9